MRDDRIERRQQRRRLSAWLPTIVVVITLLGSLAVPIVIFDRLNRARIDITEVAEPARAEARALMHSVAMQAAHLRGYLLTGSDSFVRRYREERERGEEARQRLVHDLLRIDPGASDHVRRVRSLLATWDAGHAALLEGEENRTAHVARLGEMQEVLTELNAELALIQETILAFHERRRNDFDTTIRIGGLIEAGLVLLALLAAMVVSRLSLRLESYSVELERRTREEHAFRQVASGLNAAQSIADVLALVSENASEITGADGAYVERIITPRGTVEVVATAGRGTPPRGTIVPYPGSLTEEMIARREPILVTRLAEIGIAIAPYLEAHCAECEILVAPLISNEEELGALVLLKMTRGERHFREEDIRRAKALGDLASVAMRRVSILDDERRARETAEEAVRARDEIVSIVSHDLRGPLTAITLSADLLSSADPSAAEQVEEIKSAARRMERLIGDLLDVARIERGGLALKRKNVEASAIVDEVCRSFRPLVETRNQEFECDSAGGLPVICADVDRMMQVFGNLITNATKFTPRGGTVSVQAEPEARGVRFTVADTGPGIPPSDLPNVFRRHWQAKKTAHLGAGLGLTITKGIVEAHGGTIWVENRPEGGAAFRFSIPAAE